MNCLLVQDTRLWFYTQLSILPILLLVIMSLVWIGNQVV